MRLLLKKIYVVIAMASCLGMSSCNHDDWFDRESKSLITDGQLWNDPKLLNSLLANYYNRLPQLHGVFNTGGMTELDDAMWSGHRDGNWRNDFQFGDDYGRYWDYGLIRDINLSLENIDEFSTELTDIQKRQYRAELRFIRAFVYFEMVKRMGGVPIVTTQLIYDFSGDPTPLQIPRAKEHEVYDFIYQELEAIQGDLEENKASKTRANRYTILALQSRAMLYAASLAKYNNQLASPITTPGGEVGIPASMSTDYYRKSLAASKEIINGPFQLYNENADKGANFYDMLNKKTGSEVIFAKDFVTSLKVHRFAYDNIVKSLTEDNESSSTISPSLSFVESFDYLDGAKGTLRDRDESGNYIPYANLTDIFANKDARLYGTVIYPGSTFKGRTVSVQAGVALWDNGSYQFNVAPQLGQQLEDELGEEYAGGLWTGFDGPQIDAQDVSNTGFYIRKFVSDAPAASTRGTSAANWWPWFRLGEIYLNAAEAAFELEQADARGYINTLRERAGFPANSIATLTMDIIRNERRVELAFEDHRFFDLKRWRIAHLVWDGSETDPNAVVNGLYPYRVIRPGHADNGKYIYQRVRPNRFRRARFFRLANYYSSIDQTVLNNNPKIVRNPFQ
ncbi:RagB/SusD family nutrient uptake outer membrane protein [Sphingobacterium alkalisoli]|uniref:RagB/SusD family nutrient uptake outer membrane protein n=1 Tax=Sphingobacterium alkalisoli TaxID=1874115 RepID=A0A4U0H8C4_9SPHI|nr:RagB/SusD family nutrient uptake outer membrane protein [Sphingobacterium alkalisoli]TJY67976.1 RagB/SusD family nutrient uptake outer membrane protein [Sphingobacterium alkalisoli]GGH09952.1 membrane protein [Sphingobacterium alkalisoli]